VNLVSFQVYLVANPSHLTVNLKVVSANLFTNPSSQSLKGNQLSPNGTSTSRTFSNIAHNLEADIH
jgi:hypothetical protein